VDTVGESHVEVSAYEPTIVSGIEDESVEEDVGVESSIVFEIKEESRDDVDMRFWRGGENPSTFFEPVDDDPFSDNYDSSCFKPYVSDDPIDETRFDQASIIVESDIANRVSSTDGSPETKPRIFKHDDRMKTSTRPVDNFRAKTKPSSLSTSIPIGFDLTDVKKQVTMESIISFLQGLSENKHDGKRRTKPSSSKTSKGFKRTEDTTTDLTKHVSKPSSSSKPETTNPVLLNQIRRMQTRMINNLQKIKK
jgi:hypothetical protein